MQSDRPSPSFTLLCPGYRAAGFAAGASAQPGQLTFSIGTRLVAELTHDDLIESWTEAEALSPGEAADMARVAADHLTELLDGGLAAADLTEAVTDAAVVFLLAMRRHGVTDPKRIPACSVMWHGREGREHVVLGA
ncbi:hypothetical protein [Aestuariivirga sp.]|uniref:hypothetical protein n=1 Tax=Aestuariivirga sp. TaxID=2650926 RepID=UPI00391BE8F7